VGSGAGALELTALRRRYGDVVALDGLSCTVPPGQVFGFLGPNGAGKTTAMRAIVGVASLDSGTVHWNGAAIGQEARRRIGYMPEERGLYPSMKVLEQLEYLARLHGLSGGKARTAARYCLHPIHRPGGNASPGRGRRGAQLAGRGVRCDNRGRDGRDGAAGRNHLRAGHPADRNQAQGPAGAQVGQLTGALVDMVAWLGQRPNPRRRPFARKRAS
jgi:ABC-type sugar transport system ATPase subunit